MFWFTFILHFEKICTFSGTFGCPSLPEMTQKAVFYEVWGFFFGGVCEFPDACFGISEPGMPITTSGKSQWSQPCLCLKYT